MQYSTGIKVFKASLVQFKLSKPDSPNGLWELSEQIINKISDRSEHVNYLLANRNVAKGKISCFNSIAFLFFFIAY